jgi:3-hydroxyisobutyrate dehydrogenase
VSRVAIFGLGEAGGVYANALVRVGHDVLGIDPGPALTPDGVTRITELSDTDVDHVLVITSARVARTLAREVLPQLSANVTWVDLTTASPAQKAEIAADTIPERHVDVAILGPVISQGIDTPLLASGGRAEIIARLLTDAGASISTVPGGAPGDAMAHKLLRSVLMKGLAAVVTEAMAAGAAAGREEWIREQIAAQLAGDGNAVIDRFLSGSIKHAARRSEEMAGVVEYLQALGVNADMSAGARAQLARLG